MNRDACPARDGVCVRYNTSAETPLPTAARDRRRAHALRTKMLAARLRLALLVAAASVSVTFTIPPPPPALLNLVIAGSAGAAGAICVYPIDTLKTRLQSEDGAACYGNGVNAAIALIKTEGPLSLYRGLGPQLVGVVPEKTIKLFVHDSTVLALGEVLSGALAGLCQVVVTNPLEMVKVRLQLSSSNQQSNAWAVLERMGATRNPLVLYTGAAACATRDSSFSAILFPCYAASKQILGDETQLAGALLFLIAGTLAAAPAAFFTTPADVVKTRLQEDRGIPIEEDGCAVEPPDNLLKPEPSTSQNALTMGSRVLAEDGPGAFWQGGLERILRSAPQFGITLALYETLKQACAAQGWL